MGKLPALECRCLTQRLQVGRQGLLVAAAAFEAQVTTAIGQRNPRQPQALGRMLLGERHQRIGEALRASGLDGLVRERGTDFKVGSKGKFLSGGEQRRVALSRALYKNAPLYLLDEPTSELDPETSRVVIEQILRLKQSATIFAASHDAALIEKADVVVTL